MTVTISRREKYLANKKSGIPDKSEKFLSMNINKLKNLMCIN